MAKQAASDYVRVAMTSDIAPGTVKVVYVDGHAVGVANVAGQFYAFADVCTHDDGPLAEGELDGRAIECPRHGARFDVATGAVLSMPAVTPLPVHHLKLEGDEIWVSRRPR
jgi:3-phenylpropionate/trans-cinnamate dioxygenase ferredoxin subunit